MTVWTTSSTYDTGVLDEVHVAFEEEYPVRVRTVSAGTGELMSLGERGDLDVVMAHAPSLEDEFLESGHGINRRDFAFGDFVIAGPPDDPAGLGEGADAPPDDRPGPDDGGVMDAAAAFVNIAKSEVLFVSRGDNSGTHVKELEVWDEAGTDPGGEWYIETGQNMGDTITQADEQGAYLLSVRGNFIDRRDELDLETMVEGPVTGGDPLLDNPYGVFAINPERHRGVEYELAMSYIGFLTGREGQRIIKEFTVDGEQLFYPTGLSESPNTDQYVPEQAEREREYDTGGSYDQ